MRDVIIVLERRRAELGLTVDQMAVQCGIPKTTYDSYLYENHDPTWTRGKQMLEAVGLKIVIEEKENVSDDKHGEIP